MVTPQPQAVQDAQQQLSELQHPKKALQDWHSGIAHECGQRATELARTRGPDHPSVSYLRERAQFRRHQLAIALQHIERLLSRNQLIIEKGGNF